MRFDELLEKKEAKQLMLLKHLLLKDSMSQISTLAKELDITKSSLETYIADLVWINDEYKGLATLTYDGYLVSLELAPSFSLEMIELNLYKQSIKYQILTYLYHHFDYSTAALTTRIGISESTLFRKIKELNSLLKEFGLTIWQGKLIGEESQIRYFYYCFYWYLDNYAQKEISFKQKALIHAIERGLNISFSEENMKRVNLWLIISKKRISYATPIYTELKEKIAPYERDYLFLELKSIVLRLLGHYAVEVDEEEAMIHFSFLMSFQSLSQQDYYQYAILRSKFTPVGLVDTYILESLILYYAPLKLSHQLESQVNYYLSRIHSRLYFFKGMLEVLSRKYILDTEKEWSGHVIYPLVDTLFDSVEGDYLGLSKEYNESLIAYSKLQYLHVIALIDSHINKSVKIGVKLLLEDVYQEVSTTRLIKEINGLNGVSCSEYKDNESFDLVITNKPLSYINTEIYLLSELGTNYDMVHITKLIREISTRKMRKELNVKKIQL
ncbi:helix-turn-helix domain-containing protein [Vagococcus bubulae]|uniref:helix-turn-helix domain-containing protein n=1 Tax=Vagococcus bubulae TaxID=1977868 RepID=UPI0014028C50|nr:helix-turn-helix domain-containing protein [Vagococcus bubulae]